VAGSGSALPSGVGANLLQGTVNAIPGAYLSGLAQQQFRAGNYISAAGYFGASLGDAVLAIVTLGAASLPRAGITAARVAQLQNAIPLSQQGRITMAVGLAEDTNGARHVLVGTSEPRSYLRPGVTLREGEILVPGSLHAEENIILFAEQNRLRLLEMGATRPICPACAELIRRAGAAPVTPLKEIPGLK
jgi:filamentous hemagglutinin